MRLRRAFGIISNKTGDGAVKCRYYSPFCGWESGEQWQTNAGKFISLAAAA